MGLIDIFKRIKTQQQVDPKEALQSNIERIDGEVFKLEKAEADLLSQGKKSTQQHVKRRLAAQISQLRKDISRKNTTSAMLNSKLNTLKTDEHNRAIAASVTEHNSLVSEKELTEHAVRAEEILEEANESYTIAESCNVTLDYVSQDEKDILAEFEVPDKPSKQIDGSSSAATDGQSLDDSPASDGENDAEEVVYDLLVRFEDKSVPYVFKKDDQVTLIGSITATRHIICAGNLKIGDKVLIGNNLSQNETLRICSISPMPEQKPKMVIDGVQNRKEISAPSVPWLDKHEFKESHNKYTVEVVYDNGFSDTFGGNEAVIVERNPGIKQGIVPAISLREGNYVVRHNRHDKRVLHRISSVRIENDVEKSKTLKQEANS